MAPSSIEVSQQLSCCMCEQQLEALSKLHHHQMRSHTAEELSLALLVQRGFELVADDVVRLECDDASQASVFSDSPFSLPQEACEFDGSNLAGDDGDSSPGNLVMDLDEENLKIESVLIKMEPREAELTDKVELQKSLDYGERTPERQVNCTSLHSNEDEMQESQASPCGEFEMDSDNNNGQDNIFETAMKQEPGKDDQHSNKHKVKHKDSGSIGIAPLNCQLECAAENGDNWDCAKQEPLVPLVDNPALLSDNLSVKAADASSPNVPKDAELKSSLGRHSKRKKQQTPRRYLNNQYLLPVSAASPHCDKPKLPCGWNGENEANKKPETILANAAPQQDEMEKMDLLGSNTTSEVKVNVQSLESGKEFRPPTANEASRNSSRKTHKQAGLSRSKKLSQASVNGKKSTKKIKGKKKAGIKIEKNDLKIHCNGLPKEEFLLVSENKSAVVKREAFMPISCDSKENIASSSQEDSVWGLREFDAAVKAMDTKDLMKIYPPGMTDRRFFCEPCGKGYTKKSHLERHLRVHTGERPFPCTFCGKSFAVRSILKQHVRIHTGEKPYCCSVCSNRFPQKSGLMTHMMLHTGKPFKCDRCTKAFVSNHKLLQHLRCHEGQGAHVCSVCKMNFFAEAALREHVKHHSQKHAHTCMICNASFLLEGHLKQHLDRHLEKLLIHDD